MTGEAKLSEKKLEIPVLPLKAFLEFEVRDRNGKLITRRKQRAHSWVRNLYNLMVCQAAAVAGDLAVGLSLLDTGGAIRSDTTTQPASGEASSGTSNRRIYVGLGYGFYAGAGVDSFGLVVGTGSDPENFDDHALGAKIASGNLAGQLAYSVTDAPVVSTVGTTKRIQWIRYFNNNSGGAITVNEVGMYTKGCISSYAITYMLCRDLVSAGVEVPDTGQLKVTYTIQLPYPA